MQRLAIHASLVGLGCLALAAQAQQNAPPAEVTVQEVAPGIAVLFGNGGNVGVSYGADGTLLIDDQFEPIASGLQAAVAGLGAEPARFVVNTHWHWDHAGANAIFGAAGATIVAHDSVRGRIAEGGTVMGIVSEPGAPEALPVITYDQGISFHMNGDTIDVLFLGGGHTDGDSVVFWRDANVVHMGDMFMRDLGWPFVDVDSGGDIDNLLASLEQVLSRIDDETVVIPGHGDLARRADLLAFHEMVSNGAAKVATLKRQGLTLEQALAEKPVEGLSNGEGFVPDDDFVRAVWASVDG